MIISEEEKNKSIDFIISQGMPRPQTLRSCIPKLFKSVDMQTLFFGVGDCLFLAFLAFALFIVPFAYSASGGEGSLCPAVFVFSPALYGLLHFLTQWKERMSGTYELKMTCRYTLRQLTALRMLLFGGISIIICVPVTSLFYALSGESVSFPRLMGVSFSALFIFAAVLLAAFISAKKRYILGVYAIWTTVSVIMLNSGEKFGSLLLKVPVFLFYLTAVLALSVYLIEVRHYLFDRKEAVNAFS